MDKDSLMLWGAMVATILSVVICIPPAKNVHNQGRGQGQLRHGWTVYIPPRHGQRQNQMHGQMQGEYQQVDDPNKEPDQEVRDIRLPGVDYSPDRTLTARWILNIDESHASEDSHAEAKEPSDKNSDLTTGNQPLHVRADRTVHLPTGPYPFGTGQNRPKNSPPGEYLLKRGTHGSINNGGSHSQGESIDGENPIFKTSERVHVGQTSNLQGWNSVPTLPTTSESFNMNSPTKKPSTMLGNYGSVPHKQSSSLPGTLEQTRNKFEIYGRSPVPKHQPFIVDKSSVKSADPTKKDQHQLQKGSGPAGKFDHYLGNSRRRIHSSSSDYTGEIKHQRFHYEDPN